MKKLATYLGLAMAVLVIAGAGLAYAQGGPWGEENSDLVSKITEKFDLNQDEVEEVVGEFRQEKRGQKQARQEEMLSQAVEDGKITQEQRETLEQKREEMRAEMDDSSFEERREQRDEHRQEMREWAQNEGIDLPLGQGPKGQGMHGGWNK